MPTLDEIRARTKVQKEKTIDLAPGELASEHGASGNDLAKLRLGNKACPSCGAANLNDLGMRHGGIHTRCNTCEFEFTDHLTNATEAKQARHRELVAAAALKWAKRLLAEKEKRELYAAARVHQRTKFDLLELPNGTADAVLKFGAHKGQPVSQIAESRSGRDYLRWVVGADFPEELTSVISAHIKETDGR